MIVEEWHKKEVMPCLKQVLLQDKLWVEYELETDTFIIGWEGDVNSKEIRNGYRLVLRLVHKYRSQKWILDLTKRDFINGEDRRWVFANVFSKALRFLQDNIFLAIIQPVDTYQNLVSELQGDELMYKDKFLIINHFLYQEAAQRWLNEMLPLREKSF